MAQVTPVGKYVFGSLIAAQESPFGDAPYWSIGLCLSELDAQPLLQLLEDSIKDQRNTNPKYPASNEMLLLPYGPSMKRDAAGNKTPVDGELVFKFKRKSVIKKRDGSQERQTPPIIYDSTGKIINDTINHIGWGSTGKAVFNLYPYASGRNIGISLQLIGFQIASLEAPKDEMPELAPIAGGFVADGAPVAASSDVLEDF